MSRTGSGNGTTGSRRLRSGIGAVTAACVLSLGFGASAQAAGELELGPEGFSAKAVKLLETTSTGETVEEVFQAGSHPDVLMIQFGVKTEMARNGEMPTALIRDIEIELPPGMSGNPEATPKCTMDQVQTAEQGCPRASIVGFHELDYNGGRGIAPIERTTLYNVVPPKGVVARFAMKVLPVPVVLDMRVNSDGRYTITSKISNISQVLSLVRSRTYLFGTPASFNGIGGTWKNNLGNGWGAPGQGRPVPLLTLSTECGPPQPVKFRARSWENSDHWAEASYTPSQGISGCDKLQFKPKLDLRPTNALAAAPAGIGVRLDVPQTNSPTGLATPNVRKVEVELPQGVAINPSSVHGLVGCTDEQSAVRSLDVPSCPGASRIGSVRIETPVLPGPLEGSVYLGAPKSQDSQTGEMFRVFLAASGHGATIKQEGKITPDPVTGQLRAVFDNTPQQPFSSLQVNFNDGPRSPLSNPGTCGQFTTKAKISSWAGHTVESSSSFDIDCRAGLGSFNPSFVAGTANPLAGVSAPFNLSIAKPDGQSPFNGLSLTLPKGLLANVKGNIGTQVGTATAISGLGSSPFPFPGKVYLEGPYGDAPFSLKVVVPAVAGPYNLGDVVVKQKLYIDPNDAHVTVVSDPLPTMLQGVPVQLQRLDVSVDKPGFMINPTSCEAMSIGGTLSASTGQTATVSNRFQVGGCGDLALDPKLSLKWTDKSQLRKGKHPGVEATVVMPKGNANLKGVQVTLPLTAALDPDNAKALCEAADAAARSCPEASIVGSATATTPALDEPVSGPIYFVKGTRTTKEGRVIPTLPKLYLKLSGQGVSIDLRADSSVTGPAGKQKLVTTFVNVPDVPVDTFKLQVISGENGILKATNDVCAADKVTSAVYTGQNGRVTRKSLRFTAPDCKPQVVSTSGSSTKVSVRLGGIEAGRVTISGSGLATGRRMVRQSDVATVSTRPRLTQQQKAQLRKGRTVKLAVKVTFKPTKGKAVSWKRTVTIKGVKQRAS